MSTHQILVSGKVQGVFYRVSAKKKAKELSITGWVTNKENGDVEILATGDESDLAELESWCRLGPAGADVTNVIVLKQEAANFKSFTIR